MSLEYVRRYYGVPAYRDVRVKWCDKYGKIVGSSGPHLKVLIDGRKSSVPIHPTDVGYIIEQGFLIDDDEPRLNESEQQA